MTGDDNNVNNNNRVPTFLKWAGGKRWLTKRHNSLFPERYCEFYEPFLGSGAVFFSMLPRRGLLSDVNTELIDLYKAIKKSPEAVCRNLARHSRKHSDLYYYEVRSASPTDLYDRAARTLYLNRTCWNGLFRVNRKGHFNVPRGTKNTVILPTDDFPLVARALRKVRIRCCDFEETVDQTKKGDFLFIDPPYTVKHNNNGFIKYNESLFTWEDQLRLSAAVARAARRGVQILLTNADHEPVRELYAALGEIRTLPRESVISGQSNGRKGTTEIAVRINYA